ncbi:1-acyl-sn-glycerol-3-phosphate acyltransferase [Flavobacteriales bacterium]|nr:1-acyl-sn-glycerol-3-phosphate acyltransferase [Flavobacteriales bacterium]
MKLIQKDIFGRALFLKKRIIQLIGLLSYRRFNGINNLKISGSNQIKSLPEKNVLFISNHQTYFADATAIIHVLNASINGQDNSIKNILYLLKPKLNLYFIAAKETMSNGFLPRVLAYIGSIPIQRTWRESGKNLKREVKTNDIDNINMALNDGWVITFPQGTTTPWRPVRKGTAHIIMKNKPVVIPIVIDGFRRSFDKQGLFIKKRGITQSMRIKPPLKINYEKDTIEVVVEKIELAIEQHHSFL